jgi:hypothetical protein
MAISDSNAAVIARNDNHSLLFRSNELTLGLPLKLARPQLLHLRCGLGRLLQDKDVAEVLM